MKSMINALNPAHYERNLGLLPMTYIDHFNRTPRTIRCISDGKQEMGYFLRGANSLFFGPGYMVGDEDDFTYYLRAITREHLLEEGKEYKLLDTYLEGDLEFGMVVLDGEPEESDDWEGFHGFPAFLFEEQEPVSVGEREKNKDAFWTAELEELKESEELEELEELKESGGLEN